VIAQDVATLFVAYSRKKLLEQYWPRMQSAVGPLTDEQVWWRPNEVSNSIGNLLLHLNGNVRQWLVDSFNGQKDERNRPLEFSEREGISAGELLKRLSATLSEASDVLKRLTADELAAPMEIQGYHVTGLDAVYQVVEHFGLHYGQILYIVKMLTDADLKLYRELNAVGRSDESKAHP
jgi:uncharacterized damage-inducible protein DinB